MRRRSGCAIPRRRRASIWSSRSGSNGTGRGWLGSVMLQRYLCKEILARVSLQVLLGHVTPGSVGVGTAGPAATACVGCLSRGNEASSGPHLQCHHPRLGVPVPKYVYDFTEGSKDLKDLLGGKGANLAEMTNLGLPVPPGFTITTEACQAYLGTGRVPAELSEEAGTHLAALERQTGKRLGQADDPLLVSVRSGAKFSMPGMMETVLNIGLNDESVQGLTKQSGNERFAWDSYRRLIQMFGKTVLDIDGEHFESALEAAKKAKGTESDLDLDAGDLRALVATYKRVVADRAHREFPQDPREQMDLAIRAVFDSWNAPRAILYRRQERIPADLGTAVNVVAMVFGNLGMDSGTGVAFTRDPGTGQQGIYGDYLQNAQGEDVVAGIRNTLPLQELERIDPTSYDEVMKIMATLEDHYKDLCDIELNI